MISSSDTVIADVAKGSLPQAIPIDVFPDVDDITVYEINETTGNALALTRVTHYTLNTSDEWNEAGATLTIKTGGLLTGDGWLVVSPSRYVVLDNPAREQTDDIDNTDAFDGPTFERNWDRLQLTVKRLTYMTTTCIRFREYEGSALNELGTLVAAKDTLLGFNSTTGRPEFISKSGFVTSAQVAELVSKTVAGAGSSNFATVKIDEEEEGCMVEIVAFTESGAVVRHMYMVIRENGASSVTVVKFRDTVIDDVEATEEIDISTSVSTDTVTFAIDGTAFVGSTDVDAVILVTKFKDPSDVILTAI